MIKTFYSEEINIIIISSTVVIWHFSYLQYRNCHYCLQCSLLVFYSGQFWLLHLSLFQCLQKTKKQKKKVNYLQGINLKVTFPMVLSMRYLLSDFNHLSMLFCLLHIKAHHSASQIKLQWQLRNSHANNLHFDLLMPSLYHLPEEWAPAAVLSRRGFRMCPHCTPYLSAWSLLLIMINDDFLSPSVRERRSEREEAYCVCFCLPHILEEEEEEET